MPKSRQSDPLIGVSRGNRRSAANHTGKMMVVAGVQLATAIWLRMGVHSKNEIPRSYIISACRRVLTLRKNIVERVNEFKSTLTEDQAQQLEILMSSDRSTQVLMDKTLGSSSVIDERNISILLEEMKKAQISDYAQQRDAEEAERAKAARAREAILQAATEAERKRAEKAEDEARRQREKIISIYERVIEETNRKISRERWIYVMVLSGATALAAWLGLNLQGLDPVLTVIASALVILLGAMVQLVSAAQSLMVDPWFHRRDHKALEQTAIAFALSYEEVIDYLVYDGRRFALA